MQLSEQLPILISDDHYWLEKVKNEFYFSTEEAKYLKEQMRGNYEEVYKFCAADTFELFDNFMVYSVFPDYSNEIESIEADIRKLNHDRRVNLMRHLNRVQNATLRVLPDAPNLLTQAEHDLLQRMTASGFAFINYHGHINPRKSIMLSIPPERVRCLNGRLWFNEKHVPYLLDIDKQSLLTTDILSEFFSTMFRNRFRLIAMSEEFERANRTRTLQSIMNENPGQNELDIFKEILEVDEDLSGLTLIQIKGFMMLKASGITFAINDLRHESWFNSDEHVQALEYLLEKEKYSLSNAIATLRNLKALEIEALAGQIPLEEIKKCTNEYQVKAFVLFKSKGLTGERIGQFKQFNDMYYLHALKILLKYTDIEQSLKLLVRNPLLAYCDYLDECLKTLRDYPLNKIIEIIMKLNPAQINCVINEINIEEVVGLNEVQANALNALYRRGLRGKHLRDQDWFTCPYHKDVLCYLVRKYNFHVENALDVIRQTSWTGLLKLMKKLCQLDLSNLNQFHITAFLKLDHLGLKKEHLMNCAWLNNSVVTNELIYLMSSEKKSPEDALRFLFNKEHHKYILIEYKEKKNLNIQ